MRHGQLAVLMASMTLLRPQSDGQETNLVQQLHKRAEESEKKLVSLRVEGTCHTETWNANEKNWEFGSERTVTAWYLSGARAKARVDFHKMVTRWINGPAPFSEDTYTVAYDGRINQMLFTKRGSPTDPVLSPRGQLDAERSQVLESDCATGWKYSLYGAFERFGGRLSDVLSQVADGLELQAEEASFGSVKCIRLQYIVRGTPTMTWYIDAARNCAVLGSEMIAGDGAVFGWTVDKLAEPLPGLYYPSVVHSHVQSSTGQPKERATYLATVVVMNDPKFSSDIFTIDWPPGTTVEDHIANRIFTVAGDGRNMAEKIERQVEQVRSNVTNQRTQVHGSASPSARPWLIFAGIGVLAMLVVAGTVASRRRK